MAVYNLGSIGANQSTGNLSGMASLRLGANLANGMQTGLNQIQQIYNGNNLNMQQQNTQQALYNQGLNQSLQQKQIANNTLLENKKTDQFGKDNVVGSINALQAIGFNQNEIDASFLPPEVQQNQGYDTERLNIIQRFIQQNLQNQNQTYNPFTNKMEQIMYNQAEGLGGY